DDTDWWVGQLEREIPPGLFGENLRVRGIPVSEAVVGERWSVGSALLEVTQPRTPCSTFARRLGEERWVKRFTVANRTGAYLRVVRGGELQAGDAVTVCYRPEHGVTLAAWFGAWTARGADPEHAASLARRLLAAHPEGDVTLSDEMRARAEIAAGRRVEDWASALRARVAGRAAPAGRLVGRPLAVVGAVVGGEQEVVQADLHVLDVGHVVEVEAGLVGRVGDHERPAPEDPVDGALLVVDVVDPVERDVAAGAR